MGLRGAAQHKEDNRFCKEGRKCWNVRRELFLKAGTCLSSTL